ncbi:unnamed protein product [Spirodela intermedia]|uniref:Uncharacterized protein n=1 Tax=Spirodela intermedia TaxID=51605 RepID=A0A7I8KCL5_SPIIN|nr:unnamed protein product [Spirodela intermedia]
MNRNMHLPPCPLSLSLLSPAHII